MDSIIPIAEHLDRFLKKIRSAGFWQRLFRWKEIKALSYEAYVDFGKLSEGINNANARVAELEDRLSELEQAREILSTKNEGIPKLEAKISKLEDEKSQVQNQLSQLEKNLGFLEQKEESRQENYKKNIESVQSVKQGLEDERQRLNDERVQEKENEFLQMKETWQQHESNVESVIRGICRNNFIDYMDEVPFRGKPDNTIMIADEYIIFDAKSPANNDLNNFPKYLKAQVESVKKYARQEGVKKDIYLVIPSNTITRVKEYHTNMGDYNVYVVSADSLEPIILALKRIEEYEFAEQLTPEERDNICRIIGKFAHTTKRKIQIDYFFSHQFLDILTKCKTDLPDDIMKSVIEFEKAEKLNPPQEKRSKQILTNDLIDDNEKLAVEARARIMSSEDKAAENKASENKAPENT